MSKSIENKPFPRSFDYPNGLVANNNGDEFIAAYNEVQAQKANANKPFVEQSVPDNFSGR